MYDVPTGVFDTLKKEESGSTFCVRALLANVIFKIFGLSILPDSIW